MTSAVSKIEGTWQQVEIDGKKADVYEPHAPANPSRAVLHLHGHGLTTLTGNPAYSAEFERYGLRAVCPHGGRSWWLDLISSEFDPHITPQQFLTQHVVQYIAQRWGVAPSAIGLMGISMGGQGALQLAYRRPREFPVVAVISPAIDFQNLYGRGLPLDQMFANREAARQHTATLQINPLNWPRHQLIACDPRDIDCFEGVERLAMKLSATGIPFESDLETSHGGHGWDYFNAMAPKAVEFIATRLDQESRRIH